MKSVDIDLLHSSVTRFYIHLALHLLLFFVLLRLLLTERDESPRRHSLTVLPTLTRTLSNPFIKRQSLNSHLSSYTRPAPDPRITLLPAHLSSKFFSLFLSLPTEQNPIPANKTKKKRHFSSRISFLVLKISFCSFRTENPIRRIWIVALLGSVVFRLFVCFAALSAGLADARTPPGGLCPLKRVPAGGSGQVGHLGGAGPHETGLDGRFARQPAFRLVDQG